LETKHLAAKLALKHTVAQVSEPQIKNLVIQLSSKINLASLAALKV
jgi:hypothetical protein